MKKTFLSFYIGFTILIGSHPEGLSGQMFGEEPKPRDVDFEMLRKVVAREYQDYAGVSFFESNSLMDFKEMTLLRPFEGLANEKGECWLVEIKSKDGNIRAIAIVSQDGNGFRFILTPSRTIEEVTLLEKLVGERMQGRALTLSNKILRASSLELKSLEAPQKDFLPGEALAFLMKNCDTSIGFPPRCFFCSHGWYFFSGGTKGVAVDNFVSGFAVNASTRDIRKWNFEKSHPEVAAEIVTMGERMVLEETMPRYPAKPVMIRFCQNAMKASTPFAEGIPHDPARPMGPEAALQVLLKSKAMGSPPPERYVCVEGWYFFSGGNGTIPVNDYTSGVAVNEVTGEIRLWKFPKSESHFGRDLIKILPE